MFLLDTNAISELRKPRPHGALLEWYFSQPIETLALPSITIYELYSGANRTRRQDPRKAEDIQKWITAVLGQLAILPFGTAEARMASDFMVKQPVDLLPDAMIAATAAVHNLIVVTRNVRDFANFPVKLLNPFSS